MDTSFAPAATLLEATEGAEAFFARTPWARAATVAVQLTPSTVARYEVSRNGAIRRVA